MKLFISVVLTALLVSACASSESSTQSSAPDPSVTEPSTQAEKLDGESPGPETSVPVEPEEPLYVGGDASFDYLMSVRDNQPEGWGLEPDSLPIRQEVTGRILPDMVNPERCVHLASLTAGGYLAQEGPIQYIQSPAPDDGWRVNNGNNFVVIGQAPLEATEDMMKVANDCRAFVIRRQSPSVFNDSPSEDVVTYEVTVEVLPNGYLLSTFTGSGEAQIVDENYNCFSDSGGDCMYPHSEKGFRLLRQEGENLVVAGVTNYQSKGGSASRPMKRGTFLTQAQALLDAFSTSGEQAVFEPSNSDPVPETAD